MTKLYHELIFLSTHRTKYEESGNLNIAETRGTITETRRNRNTFFHVSDRFPFQESHISAIFIMWISCGNAKLHSETSLFHFLHSAETWRYGAATCFFFLFPSVSGALTTSMSLKHYLHTQMPIFLVVNIYKFSLEFCYTIIFQVVFIFRLQAVSLHACKRAAKTWTII